MRVLFPVPVCPYGPMAPVSPDSPDWTIDAGDNEDLNPKDAFPGYDGVAVSKNTRIRSYKTDGSSFTVIYVSVQVTGTTRVTVKFTDENGNTLPDGLYQVSPLTQTNLKLSIPIKGTEVFIPI